MEEIRHVKVSELEDFKNHPFHVERNIELYEFMKSIEEEGVIMPLLVRTKADGNEFEVVSGHRRKAAAILAGLDEVPVIIKELNDDLQKAVSN